MGAVISTILTALAPILNPIKGYLDFKAKQTEANRELKLAQIQADKEAIISGNQAQTTQIQSYLNSVSRSFRQGTFFFIIIPLTLSMIAPDYAAIMWTRFDSIPEWYRLLFASIMGVIWGIPYVKELGGTMVSAISRGISNSREYRLAKKRIDREAFYNSLRQSPEFKEGITQRTVEILEKALDKGEL